MTPPLKSGAGHPSTRSTTPVTTPATTQATTQAKPESPTGVTTPALAQQAGPPRVPATQDARPAKPRRVQGVPAWRDDKAPVAPTDLQSLERPLLPGSCADDPGSATKAATALFTRMQASTVLRLDGKRVQFTRLSGRLWLSQPSAVMLHKDGSITKLRLSDARRLAALTQDPADGRQSGDTLLRFEDFDRMPHGAAVKHKGNWTRVDSVRDSADGVREVQVGEPHALALVEVRRQVACVELTACLAPDAPAPTPTVETGLVPASGKKPGTVFRKVQRWHIGGVLAYQVTHQVWYVPLRPASRPPALGAFKAGSLVPSTPKPALVPSRLCMNMQGMLMRRAELPGPGFRYPVDTHEDDPDYEAARRICDEEIWMVFNPQAPVTPSMAWLKRAQAWRRHDHPTPGELAPVVEQTAGLPAPLARMVGEYASFTLIVPTGPGDWRRLREDDFVDIEGMPARVVRDVKPRDRHLVVDFPQTQFAHPLGVLAVEKWLETFLGEPVVRHKLRLP